MNRYLLPSSTYRILLCSLFCLACLIAPSASAAQDPPPPAAAQGMHIIILIDTSNSMLEAVGARGEPKKGQESRITAIKAPLSEMIGAIEIDQKNAKNNTTLHIYEFSEGAGDKGGTKNFSKVNLCRQLDIAINEQKDRDEAKKWVEGLEIKAKWKRGKIEGVRRGTWLFTSIDQVLTDAKKLQAANPNTPISFMVISDGLDTKQEKGDGPKSMAEVLGKHGKTLKMLDNKYFIELVGFGNKYHKALEQHDIEVKKTDKMADLAKVVKKLAVQKPAPPKPKITIEALFEVKLNKTAVKPGDVKWIHEKPLVFTLIDQTIAKKMGKVQDADQKEEILKYAWSFDPKTKIRPDRNQEPNKVSLGQGDHEINLTVSDITKGENKDTAKTLNFTIKEVKIDAAIEEAQDGTLKIMQGGKVDFKFKGMPPNTVIKWDYGDGEFGEGEVPEHTYQDPSEPEMPYVVKVEITLPAGEEFTHRLGFVQVTKANAHAFAKPDNPWPGQKVIFDLDITKVDIRKVEKVTWHFGVEDVNGKEPNVAKTGPNKFSFQDTFDEPGEVKVFAKIKLKGLKQEPEAKANIVVREVLPKIETDDAVLYVGQETKYTVTDSTDPNGGAFPPDWTVKVMLGAAKDKPNEKPGQVIYFLKPGKYEVEVYVTPKGLEKPFSSKDPAKVTVNDIKIEIDVNPITPKK
jgi:hypothetical protein